MQLARRARTQRRLEPDADQFNSGAVDVQNFCDGFVAQERTSLSFIRLEQDAGVRESPSRRLPFRQQLLQVRTLLWRQSDPVHFHAPALYRNFAPALQSWPDRLLAADADQSVPRHLAWLGDLIGLRRRGS